MIIGIGIDAIEIARVENAIVRLGDRFLTRVFTPAEAAYCNARASRFPSLAARFAGKEAAMKALGRGWFDGIKWTEIEVLTGDSGAPSISLNGRALARFGEIGGARIHISLSHSATIAVAQVIFES